MNLIPRSPEHRDPPPPAPAWPAWAGLLAVLAVDLLLRWPQLALPLNRDEGEFAYGGQLLRAGELPYVSLFAMKLPGMYLAMAGVQSVVGESVVALHLAAAAINAVSTLLVFLIAWRLFGRYEAVCAAAVFMLWMLNPRAEPLAAQAEVFLLVPALAGWWCLLRAEQASGQRFAAWHVAAGLGFGLAVLIKQHGAALGVAAWLWSAWHFRPRGDTPARPWSARAIALVGMALAGAAPLVATGVFYAAVGRFDRLWLWTVTCARYYAAGEPLDLAWENLVNTVSELGDGSPLLWLLTLVGLSTPLWMPAARRHGALLLALGIASIAAITPALIFRGHYFYYAGPIVGLLAALALRGASDLYGRLVDKPAAHYAALVLLPLAALGYTAYRDAQVFWRFPTELLSRRIYGLNPFPESEEIAQRIARDTQPDDRVAILGSEPQIFYLSGRRSATPYIYTYTLMDEHDHALEMQREMIADIERVKPKYFLWVTNPQSWLRRPKSHGLILDWAPRYSAEHYELTALYDVLSPFETVRRYDAEAQAYAPRDTYWVGVYRRKTSERDAEAR